jgi:hypothetical protein
MKYFHYFILILLLLSIGVANATDKGKTLTVTKIEKRCDNPRKIPALMDRDDRIEWQNVDVINWEKYPYLPEVKFRIAYTEDAILLHYVVTEATVRGVTAEDNGPVYKDSCVEFFLSPEDDGLYYNLECNCIGTVLFGSGGDEKGKVLADENTLKGIKRWASSGNKPFDEIMEQRTWEVAIIFPYSSLFRHEIETLEGKTIRANFYKCGDALQTRHYVSWNPIGTKGPSFHTPQYFGTLIFK